ncbi:hypothetical protein LEP1GSC193_3377 [Leptospira alstonii serovar Pingchang str. 80-412]|uniref:Uncharacterized protein n=2 Tax=Leptospira alstonii TaxID=28452 RepID=M6DGV6_9LEPT|nr:hypothetical protein LEP1GSC194_3953 [Leptospira alstonii serovar Sichuan str. 79601]EQA82040.1 hypothetical protein LEP1GSC193_3377 [Leptospira alstonii serovar Pingchang str. 80-412]
MNLKKQRKRILEKLTFYENNRRYAKCLLLFRVIDFFRT